MKENTLFESFQNPPKGYGNVPFYWWTGDRLDKERIARQLEALSQKGISGVQINFAHDCWERDGSEYRHMQTLPCDPPTFSDEWWDIFNFTLKKAKSLGMGVGISDYTIGWIDNGYFVDQIAFDPELQAIELVDRHIACQAGVSLDVPCGETLLNATAVYADGSTETITSDRFVPRCDGEIILVTYERKPKSLDIMNPRVGETLCRLFFEYVEAKTEPDCRDALNYFFQDEFTPRCDTTRLWSNQLETVFLKEKGYDLRPWLHVLFCDLGADSARVRLDYHDVKAQLIEDGYFKPIFRFHQERGLIYGCDQMSRGYDPIEYGDYFRTVRWFTAPGNDTPGRHADLIKVKVNSSIAHLYQRPRVWLEGYHSSGWGTSLDSLSDPTSDNFLYGANLLCLHGLYYSTYGGFWEWAPPDCHFRMPYWRHATGWFRYYERLSYLLTRGNHRCDLAIYYPTTAMECGLSGEVSVKSTFSAANALHEKGIDFDFVDFQSLERATVEDASLCVAGERYQAVLLCNIDCIRQNTLEALADFAEKGGTVLFDGCFPQFTDFSGRDEGRVERCFEKIRHYAKLCDATSDVTDLLNGAIRRDFIPLDGDKGCVFHRSTEEHEVYFVRHVEAGRRCAFQTDGYAQYWDATNGKRYRLCSEYHDGYSYVTIPDDGDNLIVFGQKEEKDLPLYMPLGEVQRKIDLDDMWEIEIHPTLDNRDGDFRLPVTQSTIGPEVCHLVNDQGMSVQVGSWNAYEKSSALSGPFETVSLWDRYGIVTSGLNEQGFHGLKKYVGDETILLAPGEVTYVRTTFFCEQDAVLIPCQGFPPLSEMRLDNQVVDVQQPFAVSAGHHVLQFCIKNDNDKEARYPVVWYQEGLKDLPSHLPLTNRWFANSSIMRLSAEPFLTEATFHFKSAPGLQQLSFTLFGDLQTVTVNGVSAEIVEEASADYGAKCFVAKNFGCAIDAAEVRITVIPFSGYTGGAIFAEPIREETGIGRLSLGDWSQLDGLSSYSGAIEYRTKFSFIAKEDERIVLELGAVSSSCAVSINGHRVAERCRAPYVFEITEFVKQGENELSIEVCNTLCNHYSMIPSRYSGWPEDRCSGLLGPVSLAIYKKQLF